MFKTIRFNKDITISFINNERYYDNAQATTVRLTNHNETVEVSVHSDRWIDVAREAWRLQVLYPENSNDYKMICNICLGLAAKMETFQTIYFSI